jgi:hypothetical protein
VEPVRAPEEAIDMAARAADVHELRTYPARRPSSERDPKEIVAVVLADGSVRDLGADASTSRDGTRFASGRVSGKDWVLWWERRAFDPA